MDRGVQFIPAGGQQNQAIGRTKGGLNTKLSAGVEGGGPAISVSLAAGQLADVTVAKTSARPACAERSRWPTKVTTATNFGRNCGVAGAARAFHRVAIGASRPVGIAVITANDTRWKTCFSG